MKKFNLKLIAPLILTFILQGCTPDSMTKFKKDPPKKAAEATVTSPAVDPTTGAVIPLDYPTVATFSYALSTAPTVAVTDQSLKVGTAATTLSTIMTNTTTFGSLADAAKKSFIFVRCELDQTGAVETRTLPLGMTLNASTCAISGTPTVAKFNPLVPGGGNYAYTVNLLYKGASYTVAGTESKLTSTITLGSYHYTNEPGTTVTAAFLAASVANINVLSTNMFPAAPSTIRIGDEIISYTGVTATSFTGITRAQGGTVAADHAIGDRVIPGTALANVKDVQAIDYPAAEPVGFSYTEQILGVDTAVSVKDMVVGTAVEFDPLTVGANGTPDGVAGTLSHPIRSKYIFVKCEIDQTGPSSTKTLPPGLSIDANTCLITGTPTAAYSDTTFGNMGGLVTYAINLYYKDDTYTGTGTEVKITTRLKLMSHTQPVLDAATWIAPTAITMGLAGTSVPISTTINFEVGVLTKYAPFLDGTLADRNKYTFALVNCSLTGTLPTGLSFNTTNCVLGGTPTVLQTGATSTVTINLNYKDPTYTGPGDEQTVSTVITIGIYRKPTLLTYTQHDRLLFTVSPTTLLETNTVDTVAYDRNGVFTSSDSISGIIKYVDSATSKVGVIKVTPVTVAVTTGAAVDSCVYGSNGAIGKIQKISGSVLYVERLTPALSFAAAAVNYGACGLTYATALVGSSTISSIDTTHFFNSLTAGLDNDNQYFSTKYNQSNITMVYQKGVALLQSLTPIPSTQIDPNNGLAYSISPALPAGLSFSTTTGAISGTFTDTLDSTKFTITATNPLGSTSTSIYLSAIEAPTNLGYTKAQLLTVGSTANFNEGEYIFQPLTPPLTESITGRIIRIYSATRMSVLTFNGEFLKDVSIDSGNAYYAEKTTVTADPVSYNISLTVSDAAVAAPGDYLSGANGALGLVMDEIGTTLFVRYLNTSATPTLFKQDNNISEGATYDGLPVIATISQIEAINMKLTLSSTATLLGIKSGDEITALAGDIGGYIQKVDANDTDIYVGEISRRPTQPLYFKKAQTFINSEVTGVAIGSFNEVYNDNFILAERAVRIELKPNLTLGNGVIYSVTPTLPAGLTLSSTTGLISGTPTYATPRTTYTVSAKNLVNESTFVFDLETRDYFKITASASASAPSFNLHKYGDSRINRKCRINATDIKNFAANSASVNGAAVLDVRCFMEGEEEDLYLNKLKLLSSAGSGVCEYIQIYPYSFWQWQPVQTPALTPYTEQSGCIANAAWSSANNCAGNHENDGGPNCDEGTFSVTSEVYTYNTTTSTCDLTSTATATRACAGKTTNCLKGPVRDIGLTDADIISGARSTVTAAVNGATVTSTFASPVENLDSTNLRVSNGTINNACTNTNADADSWTTVLFANKTGNTPDNPLSFGANPYYTINCLDAAHDIKARIRVIVRDWNKTFKMSSNIDLDEPGGAGAPTFMNKTGLNFGVDYNNRDDWDDDYAGAAADFGGTCAVPVINTEYAFPEDNI